MRKNNLMNLPFLNFNINILYIFIIFISFIFGELILLSGTKAFIIFGMLIFLTIFLIKVEYVFFGLLFIRPIIEMLYDIQIFGNITVTVFIGVGVSFLFLMYLILNNYNFFEIKLNKIYILFLTLGFIPVFFSKNISEDFGYWLKLLQGFLFFNMTILIIRDRFQMDENKINLFFRFCFLSVIIPLILYTRNVLKGTVHLLGGYERFTDFYAYDNAFAYLLLIIFPICVFFYYTQKVKYKKIFFLSITIIFLLYIYSTYTRNVWIGIMIFIFSLNFFKKNYKILISVVVSTSIFIMFSTTIQDRLKDINKIMNYESFWDMDPRLLSSRIGNWQENLKYFLDKSSIINKLFGNGFGKAIEISGLEAHNNYLTLLIGVGIFGLIIYLFLLIEQYKNAKIVFKNAKNENHKIFAQIYLAFIITYVFISLITHIIWQITFQWYFAVFTGIIVCFKMSSNKKKNI